MTDPPGHDEYEELVLGEAEVSLDEISDYVELDGRGAGPAGREQAARMEAFLRGVAGRLEGPAAAQCFHDLGELRGRSLEGVEEAVAASREAFRLWPEAAHVARGHRRALLRAGGPPAEVAAALEREARSEACARRPDRAALELARARLLEGELEALDAAREACALALEADPTSVAALSALERIARRRGEPLEAARHAEKIAELVTDPRLRAEHAARAARHLERAHDLAGAVARAEAARAAAPASPAAAFALERLYAREGRTDDLVALREAQMAEGVIDPGHGWFDVGLLARYRLGDQEKARAAFELALELGAADDASRLAILRELSPLLRAAGAWQRLIEVETQRATLEPTPTARAAAWHRRGVVEEQRSGDEAQALRSFEEALITEDRSYAPALEDAGRLYFRSGSRDRLLAMTQVEAEIAASRVERAGALRRSGELLVEDPERLEEGIAALRRAAELSPGDPAPLAALERILGRRGAWAELAQAIEEQLPRCADAALRAALLLRLAPLAERLGDRGRAIEALREAAALDADPPPAHLVTLARLLEEDGRLDELVPVLEQIAARTQAPAQLASQLERLAETHKRRGAIDASLDAYRRALEVAPPSHPVTISAAWAFLRAGRFEDLADLYLQAASESEGAEGARWLHRAAAVMIDHLDRRGRAADVLRHALAEAPDHAPSRVAIEELLADAGSWHDLRALLAADPPTGTTLLRQAALAEATGDVEAAAGLYGAALEAGATVAALPHLRCLAETGAWAPLLARYRAMGEGPGEAPGPAPRSPVDRVHALCRAAEIALERLDDRDAARLLLERALEIAPVVPIAVLAALALEASSPGRTRELLGALLHVTEDPATRRACLVGIQASFEDAGQTDEVLAEQLRLADKGLQDPVTVVAIELGLEARGDRKRAAEALRALVALPGLEPGLAADLQARLAALLDEAGAPRQAAEALEAAIAAGPQSLARLVDAARLAGATGDRDRLAVALERLSAALPRGPERSVALRRLSRCRAEAAPAGELEPALAPLEDALRDDPLDTRALALFASLAAPEAGSAARVVDHVARALSLEVDAGRIARLGTCLAAHHLRAGRLEPAREALERAIAAAPTDVAALGLLAEVHRRAGAWGPAAERLRQLASLPEAPTPLRSQAARALAAVLAHKLDDPGGARELVAALIPLEGHTAASLAQLLSAEALVEDHRAAADILERLVEAEGVDEEARAAALLRLGGLQEGPLGDAEGAMRTLARVGPGAGGHQLRAARHVLALADTTQRWDLAAETLEGVFAAGCAVEPAEELALRRRLAGILDERLGLAAAAIPHYERVVALDPADAPALARLAELCAADAPERAVDHHRALLALQPDRLGSYRALRPLLLRLGHEGAVFCVEAVLDGLGVATEEESYFYTQRRSKLAGKLKPGAALSAADWRTLCPRFDSPALALLRALTPALREVFPVDLASFGVAADEDAVGLKAVREIAAQVAALFEIDGHEVAAAPPKLAPTVLGGSPVTLLVPRDVTGGLPREQLFLCGALLGRARVGGVLGDPQQLHRTTDQQLAALVWAACELSSPGFEAPTEHSHVFADLRARLAQALPEVLPDTLREACARLVGEGGAVDGAWLRAEVNAAAARAGALTAVDPAIAVACFRQWRSVFSRDEVADGHGLYPEAWSGLAFAVSAACQAMRERLGIGIQP